MDAKAIKWRSSVLGVLESLLYLVSIPLSLTLFVQTMTLTVHEIEIELEKAEIDAMEAYFNPVQGLVMAALLFGVLAIIQGIRTSRARGEGKGPFAVALFQSALFVACAILPVTMGFHTGSLRAVSVLYAIAMSAGRILSIVRNHRVINVIWNIACILVLGASTLVFIATTLLILFLAVLSIMKIIFGRVRMSTLLAIIRKTYAAEILFGLVLLISTFSILLSYFEPGMTNLKDAFWYCFAIVTTIGFGDYSAVTSFGRVLSVILGAYGIVVVALITSIIVNYYGEMKRDENIQEPDEAKDGDAKTATREQA